MKKLLYIAILFLTTNLSAQYVNCDLLDVINDSLVIVANGKPYNGTCEKYHPNGQLEIKITAVNGIMHGKFDAYYATGALQRSIRFKHGKKHGKWVIYYPDGKVFMIETYKKGLRHGLLAAYNTDGKETSREMYKNGEVQPVPTKGD